MWFVWLIAVVIVVCVNLYLAGVASGIASDKGYNEGKWFHICFWLGAIGYLMVAGMPDKNLQKTIELQQKILEKLDMFGTVSVPEAKTESPIANQTAQAALENVQLKQEVDVECKEAYKIPDGTDEFGTEFCKCSVCGSRQKASRIVCWDCERRFKN